MRFITRFSGMRNAVNSGRLNFGPHHMGGWFSLLILLTLSALVFTAAATAQTTVGQGSIQGAITDPSGAVVPGAKIMITNKATGQVATTTTSSSGTYNSGGLTVGDYSVRIEAKGFKTTQFVTSRSGRSDVTGKCQAGGRAGEHRRRSAR